MTPYYRDELVTIYLGDSRELELEVDAVVTDPPYGVNARTRYNGGPAGERVPWADEAYPHDEINRHVEAGRSVLSFGSAPTMARELAAFVGEPRVLVWAPRFRLGMVAKDGLSYRYHPIYAWRVSSTPARRDVFDEATEVGNWWNHPATKPLTLMLALVNLTSGVVLDPFAGSGTTLVAAKALGRKAIGVELDERWCEVAARRCSQGTLGLELQVEDLANTLELA